MLRREFLTMTMAAALATRHAAAATEAARVQNEHFADVGHMVEFWRALGGGQRDAGLDGSQRSANQLAIVPDATHYSLAADPRLAGIVERFLAAG